jgi:hypothetical protein
MLLKELASQIATTFQKWYSLVCSFIPACPIIVPVKASHLCIGGSWIPVTCMCHARTSVQWQPREETEEPELATSSATSNATESQHCASKSTNPMELATTSRPSSTPNDTTITTNATPTSNSTHTNTIHIPPADANTSSNNHGTDILHPSTDSQPRSRTRTRTRTWSRSRSWSWELPRERTCTKRVLPRTQIMHQRTTNTRGNLNNKDDLATIRKDTTNIRTNSNRFRTASQQEATNTMEVISKAPTNHSKFKANEPQEVEEGGKREVQREETLKQKDDIQFQNTLKNMETYIKGECRKRYGLVSDVNHPKWENTINALKTINPDIIELGQPTNLAFHNLSNTNLPTGAHCLLSLSLKFCIAEQCPPLAIKATLQ